MGRPNGKVTFITVAGAGIAKASALAFARKGAQVALAEIRTEQGRATEEQIREAGSDAFIDETDVTQDESVKCAIDAATAPATVRTERSMARWGNQESSAPKPSADAQARNAANRKLYPFSVAESEDIAAVALFLASNESRGIAGTVIPAGGGRSSCVRSLPTG